jgi:acyl transferase domain-containing protein/NAD(P)-dependent dehydrogenase (short-subunit alcohol dehydrogenase family)/acyl-CoA thioesterase FadM
MGVFAWPYRVLFQDTMAYGWHHFLTNFKFQCEAREQLLFTHWMTTPEGRAESEDLVLLTHEGYTRNLAPVALGDTVGVLLSHEDASPSTVRVCFRVVRSDGTPVCCGFQTVVSSTRAGAIVPASPATRRFGLAFREKLTQPSFAERVLSGIGLDRVFDEETLRLGKATAAGPAGQGKLPPSFGRPVTEDALVFAFPGAGSITPTLLAELAAVDFLGAGALVRRAEQVAQDVLGASLEPLVENRQPLEHLRRNPDLAQIAIYLANVIPALWLEERGARPDILVGHSLGEIAALALGGACTLETGLASVAARARALRQALSPGGMLILFCHARRARSLLEVLGRTSLEIAVVNLPEQTVISGKDADLETLAALAAHTGVTCTRLESNFPFHSRLLEPCVAPFAEALRGLPLHAPERAVFSPMERDFYSSEDDLPRLLASHLVRPLAFDEALRDLHELGARRFVECGGGRALTGLVSKALQGKAVRALATLPGDSRAGLRLALEACGVRAPLEAPPPTPAAPRLSAELTPAAKGAVAVERTPADAPGPLPIAVVGMGCVLPGAHDPAQLWDNVLGARVAISDQPPHDPRDFSSEGDVPVADKTYSRLGGWVRGFVPDPALGTFPTDAQRFLAAALAQCLAGARPDPRRTHLLVGSTGDGCREYEEALVLAGLDGWVREAVADPAEAEGLARELEVALGRRRDEGADLSPWPLYCAVGERVVGAGVRVLAFDAACASSLYAIASGVRSLRRGECDLALAGGVFTPGAPNASLFAQFRGLSAKGSRPFDARADGVVFGEGAGLLALKRLPDALAAKDRVYAIVRGFACASDGKSPSVMEPREAGQILALRRAYQASGVDPATVQLLEAHATATPVGDAVEVKAAAQLLRGSGEAVALGSLKANIGHTGWAAGVASVIKVVGAFSSRAIPPQASFAEASPRLELERTRFFIPTRPRPWPENVRGAPRRAAVNGFGFGGSNAHLVLEEFQPGYHAALAARSTAGRPGVGGPPDGVAVVALSLVRPAAGVRFTSEELALPDGVRILPDVVDHMDRGQVLAIQAAHRALRALPGWEKLAEETGVILGVEGKTGRGVDATLRVFRDHLARRLREQGAVRVAEVVASRLDKLLPSGPYTLLGLMPNVIAGRISTAFNLKGGNLVVDAHRASLLEAIELAARWVEGGECKLVLAGAIHGHAHPAIAALVHASRVQPEARPLAEAAVLLALTPIALARERGWEVLAVLGSGHGAKRLDLGGEPVCLLGAEGALEVARALDAAARGEATTVAWPDGQELAFVPASASADPKDAGVAPAVGASPIEVAEPRLFPRPLPPSARPLALGGRRVLAVASDPRLAGGLLAGVEHRVVAPGPARGALPADLATDATLRESLERLDFAFDAVIAVQDLAGRDTLASACREHALLETLLGVARHAYPRLERGEVVLGAVAVNASSAGRLHPATGLLSGFAKSLARELPRATIRVVCQDDGDVTRARERLELELGQSPSASAPVEVAYLAGERRAFRLVVRPPGEKASRWLDAESVTLLTGGARGITAVLAEELLRRSGGTVVLLGRTERGAAPPELVALDDAALAAHEQEFYASELARMPQARMSDLRGRFEGIRAAREVARTLDRLRGRPGRALYLRADVTDATAVSEAVSWIVQKLGRLDLVVHGAGVQSSKVLPKRTLDDVRRILGTKLRGLANLHDACVRHLPGRPPRFHLLTSAFSYVGNPGQPDYGAANEAMDRLAACRAGDGWSTLAWLGWDGTGMTRGSEYRSLALAEGLQFVTPAEGSEVFSWLLEGRLAAPVNVVVRGRSVMSKVPLEFGEPPDVPAARDADLVAATFALIEAPAPVASPLALRGRRVLVASDRPDWCRSEAARGLLSGIEHRFVVPAGSGVDGALELDLASDESLARSLAGLEGFDTILAHADVEGEDLSIVERRPLLELVFALARHAYSRIASGEVVLGALVLGARRPGEQLHPLTGLLAGFFKSLARELPQARIKVVSTEDPDPRAALARLEGELGAPGWPVEVVFREGRRFTLQLVHTDVVAVGDGPGPEVVVVATGGGRGVTAVLVEAALQRGGTAVLLGRSDPASVPADLLTLDDAAFAAREPTFYEAEVGRGGRLPELRARWQAWAAGREVAANLARLATLPGARVSYRRCDVLDSAQVDATVEAIAREHGRIDLAIHGAGVQTSKLLPRRTLSELRRIVATKLDGLENLRRACARHLPGARPHFHVVSSVAGFAGNPGQADYAAANDALVRLAMCRAAQTGEGEWSAIAWPGWDGIGMARGSEYAAIAAATGQRWLSREEGKAFFARVVGGRPALAALAPVRESELAALGMSLVRPPGKLAAAVRCELSVATHPFLAQHTVGGVPTAPGAYLLELAAQGALSLRPGRRVVRFEHAAFERFVKVPARGATLTVLLRVVAEDDRETVLQARVVSDFVHPGGAVLQRGIEHARGFVVLAPRGAPLGGPRSEDPTVEGIELADPYQSPHSPVRLTGPFGALGRLVCRPRTTSALFRSREQPRAFAEAVLPVLQLDALFRVAGTCSMGDNVPISVPVACGRLELSDHPAHDPSFLIGATPRFEGDTVLMDWGEAHAPDGKLLLRFSNGVGRRVGSVPRAAAARVEQETWR